MEDRRQYQTQPESADNGRTWSQPVPTDFSDATSKFFAMTCADGRVALVSNPAPDDLRRRFLALALSDDGGRTFTDWRKASLGQGGRYATRAVWRRLDCMRAPGRLVEVRCSEPVEVVFSHLELNATRPAS